MLLIAVALTSAPSAEPQSAALPQSSLKLIITVPPVPVGAVAQVRLALTSPIPISSGAIEMEFDRTVFGPPQAVDVFSAAGDQTGSASFSANRLRVSFSSRSGGIGRLPSLPILAVSIPVLGPSGSTADLQLVPSDVLWRDVQGNRYVVSAERVRFRTGGSLSIDGVTPGGGLLPAGTRVRIEGRGFSAGIAVQIDGVPLTSTEFISPNTIDVRVAAPVDLTGRPVRVRNANGESADFYPALRPGMVLMPNGDLVQYVFPQQLFVAATEYLFALQNPYLEPVTATLHYPPPRNNLPSTSRPLKLSPGEVFYSWMDRNSFGVSGFSSTKAIRVAMPGTLNASGITGATVTWINPPPTCLGTRIAIEGACWVRVAGSGPDSALLRVRSNLAYVATAKAVQGDWLKVSPETGIGGDVTVTLDPRSLSPGDYDGTVTINFGDAEYAAAKIPLTLRVTESMVDFRNAPPYFFFTGRRTDPPPPPIQVDVIATKDGTPFRIDLESNLGTEWLLISPREGVTPATLDITFNPSLMSPDVYRSARVVLSGPTNTVTKPAGAHLTEIEIGTDAKRKVFWAKTDGAAPAPQTIGFGYSNVGWQACFDAAESSASTQSGGSWLNAVRAPRSNTIAVSVSADRLGAGTYEGAVLIAAPSTPGCPSATIPVILVVTGEEASVAVEPPTIDLTVPSGSDSYALASLTTAGYVPAVEARVVLAEQRYPVDFSFTVATEDNVDWLVVSSDSARAAGILNVRGNGTNLPPGTYRGSIRVNAPAGSKNVVVVPVTLRVSAALPVYPLGGPPLAASLVNAASQTVGAMAPGELLTIHGTNLALDETWLPERERRGVRVLLDEIEAPLLYASPTQLNLAAPAELTGKSSVTVAIESNGLRTVTGVLVAESSPGLFTADGTGAGQAFAFNLPSGEPNSARQPVARGSEIRILATGLGQAAQSADQPIVPVSVRIANVKASVKSIAPSSGISQGLFDIDLTIPNGISPGIAVPVVIEAGSASSQERVTIAVR